MNRPWISGNEGKYLQEAIASGWVSSDGPFVERFEREFAAYIGREYAIAVSSGTAALDIAVEALGITRGDEVLVPALTIISCINQILRSGAKPCFVDCDATLNMDPKDLRAHKNTRAVMMVHLYGLPCDADPILEFARAHELAVIEDASQMHGQTYKGRKCGTLGDISTFSFYANKIITTGEGGMILTDDASLADKCRSLRNLCHGQTRFVHERIGWNYRMSNLQAAVGCAQLERIQLAIDKKRYIGALYDDALSEYDVRLKTPIRRTEYAENIYWAYPLIFSHLLADEAMPQLKHVGVDTRGVFLPLHLQPCVASNRVYEHAEEAWLNGVLLPAGLGITEGEIAQVCEAVKSLCA